MIIYASGFYFTTDVKIHPEETINSPNENNDKEQEFEHALTNSSHPNPVIGAPGVFYHNSILSLFM